MLERLVVAGVLLTAGAVLPSAGAQVAATQPNEAALPPVQLSEDSARTAPPDADSAAPERPGADFAAQTQPAAAPAAETQPARDEAQQAVPDRLLEVLLLELQLEFEGSYDRHESEADTGGGIFRRTWRQTNQDRRFEETLALRSEGSVFDEQWLLYEAFIRGGFVQERFSERGTPRDRVESPDGDLLEYDVTATLFPRGKLSVTGFAQRLDSRVPRAFQPSLDRTYERYGAELVFSDAKLPMRLRFEHVWDELTSRTQELLDDEQRGRDVLQYEATWQIDRNHSLRLDYEYEDRQEQYSGSDTRFDTTRHYLTLNHVLRFGKDDRSALETLVRMQDERGDLARDQLELSTRLRLQHTEKLSTNWAAQYLRDGYQELTTRTWRGEGGLTYRFSEALTASVQLYALDQDNEEATDFVEWGGLATAAYSRDNAWGRFSANVSYNHTHIDTRDGTRRGIVLNESLTLRDPLPAYLVHEDVDRRSILVTSADRSRTYLPGRDYAVVTLGRFTALLRVRGGNITDRETVLVSYTYRVYGDYELARDRVDYRFQQAFEFGLTPYYAGSIQHETLSEPRFVNWPVRNVNRHRFGATYRRPRWSVGAEYEYNDDGIDPYQAVHTNGDVVLFRDVRQQLDGKGTLSRFWFDGSYGLAPRNATLLDLGLSYRYLIAQDLEATASALYRFEDDSLFGDTHGVDVTGGLEWRIGEFSLSFEAEYDMLDLPGSDDDTLAVWLKLKRTIPILARRPE